MRATADVVIIGGGCMGVSTAYHLIRRGVTRVVLVEREPLIGAGSTGRNAGGVRHQFSHQANIGLSIESIQAFERFHDELGQAVDFRQDGYLFLLSSQAGVEIFRRNVDLQRRLGVMVDWLTGEQAARLVPGLVVDGVLAATYCARDGIVDPSGVTQGFARAAQAAGVEICRETEAVGIVVERGQVRAVQTTRGAIATPIVVNAAGPHARSIGEMAGLDVPVLPYRRHIFIARAAVLPASHTMVIDFETTFYFHREGANVLFGMADPDDPPGFDLTVNWEVLERVTPIAVTRWPALVDAPITRAWAGLYEMTPDAMPIIGPAPHVGGFYLITGFSGHGFQHSPAAGRVLADLIVGRDSGLDVRPFAFDRFSTGALDREANVV